MFICTNGILKLIQLVKKLNSFGFISLGSPKHSWQEPPSAMSDGEVLYFECVNRYNPHEYGHGKEHIAIDPGDALEVDVASIDLNAKGGRQMPEASIEFILASF